MKAPGWVIAMIAVVALVHQGAWFWDDPTLVGGFLPIGLAYHGAFSLVAAAMWAVVVWAIWPDDDGGAA